MGQIGLTEVISAGDTSDVALVWPGTHGVVGNGVANDTAAIKTLLTNYRQVVLMGGSFAVGTLTWTNADACADLSCAVGGKITRLPSANHGSLLVYAQRDNARLHHIVFEGVVDETYQALTTNYPAPGILLRIDKPGARIYGVTVENCEFIGGQNGVSAFSPDFLVVRNNKFRSNYTWPCSITNAARKTTIEGNDFEGNSIYEAIKCSTVLDGPGDATEDLIVVNNFIRGVGRLGTGVLFDKEAIDLFMCAGRRVRVSGNHIVGAGSGGIEIKRQPAGAGGGLNVSPYALNQNANPALVSVIEDRYADIVLENNLVILTTPSAAFTINNQGTWGVEDLHSLRGILIRGNSVRAEIRDASGVLVTTPTTGVGGVAANACTDLVVKDNEFYLTDSMIYLAAGGGYDTTIYRATVQGNVGHLVNRFLVLANKNVDLVTMGNFARCLASEAVQCGTGSTVTGWRSKGNTILTPGTYGMRLEGITDALFEDDTVESAGYAAHFLGDIFNAELRNCTLKTTTNNSVRITGSGTLRLARNALKNPVGISSRFVASGTPTVHAHNNDRGFSAAAPTGGGALGDVFYHEVPTTTVSGWRCTTAHATAATWTAFN